MPFVKIYYRRDKHADPKPIGDAVHEALVAQANVPRDDRFQVFLPLDNIVADPAYGGVQRSDRLVIVEITLNAGRTVEIKKNLYTDIARRLDAAGIRPDDVMVSLVEVTKENWSFGGGRATYAQVG